MCRYRKMKEEQSIFWCHCMQLHPRNLELWQHLHATLSHAWRFKLQLPPWIFGIFSNMHQFMRTVEDRTFWNALPRVRLMLAFEFLLAHVCYPRVFPWNIPKMANKTHGALIADIFSWSQGVVNYQIFKMKWRLLVTPLVVTMPVSPLVWSVESTCSATMCLGAGLRMSQVLSFQVRKSDVFLATLASICLTNDNFWH